MKIVYRKTLTVLSLFISFISCSAQTLPLNTALASIPNNAHVKNTNNELSPYIGIYKANYEGKEITLYITKEDDRLEARSNKQFYRDALVIKYIVKNSTGTILQDTKNNNLDIDFHSTKIKSTQNSVIFFYSGTNCNVGWGDVYLKKVNATQISWEYRPNDIVTTASKCPPTLDTTIYLPETKDLIFTKQ
ncbi:MULTISPECIES: DUF6705 family protein [Chryseobacterium]|uniref:DUF6705 family protein n=1 Tax=Chryseobacterium TaxID=59732 RepID=UPI001627E34A|nr:MULTISPECIES: DUF6705 family protein [Chryseobacterium]